MTLDEIRKMIDEATPAPWLVGFSGSGPECLTAYLFMKSAEGRYQIRVDHRRDFSDPAPDARFIAAARTLLPALLNVAEAASDPDIGPIDDPGIQERDAYARLERALAALEALRLP